MAKISSFKGIRYGKQFEPYLRSVTAPPYDVLSKDQVAEMHAENQFNITHLTRPTSYASAGEIWNKWLENGTLVEDKPSLYIYSQTFIDPETGKQMPPRLGLICALELEDYSSGTVVPHENTIAAHRADRLELMRASDANFESIYGLYSDPNHVVLDILHEAITTAPVIGIADNVVGSDHKLQQITDPVVIEKLEKAIAESKILIADGHHRYETSLAYQREHTNERGAGQILITLTAFEDDGLLVLPTHRLVRGLTDDAVANLPQNLIKAGFEISQIDDSTPVLPAGSPGFDVLSKSGLIRALLPVTESPSKLIDLDFSDAWKSLDVSILSVLVLDKIFGISLDSLGTTDQVRYTRDGAEARQKISDGEFQFEFLLSRPSMDGIQKVGAAGEKMPQKSTFFYPKLLSGLVMRKLS